MARILHLAKRGMDVGELTHGGHTLGLWMLDACNLVNDAHLAISLVGAHAVHQAR